MSATLNYIHYNEAKYFISQLMKNPKASFTQKKTSLHLEEEYADCL